MSDKNKKQEGPACACGKGDLYEEWLKANKEKEKEETESKELENKDENDDSDHSKE